MPTNPKLPTVSVKGGGARYPDSVRRRVLAALKLGGTRTAAAESSGIHRDTFFEWMKEPEFEEAVRQAEAAAELHYTRLLRGHAARDPRSVQFWLERRGPKSWREKVSVLGEDQSLEDVIDESLDDDELRGRLADLAREALRRGSSSDPEGDGSGDPSEGSED